MSAIQPALFDVKDAIAYLHLSRARIYELLTEGALTACKVGAKTMFRRTELERFIAALPEAQIGRGSAA